jgi:hypothetical protein
MADFTRIEELTWKKLLGEITPDEEKELLVLAKASKEDQEWVDRMLSEPFRQKLRDLRKIDYRKLDRAMNKKIAEGPGVLDHIPVTTILPRFARPLRIAASIAVVAASLAGLSKWVFHKHPMADSASHHLVKATLCWQATSDVPGIAENSPGCNTIELGEMADGKPYKAGQIQINRMGNEFWVHQAATITSAGAGIVQYKLTVAGMENIQLFFQEGTRTQIYPGSGLFFNSYSSNSTSMDRRMTCYGRVLFNVSHNVEHPFVVKTPKQEITVLGTLFEVHDYTREDTGAVYCFSGKVSVKDSGRAPRTLNALQRITVHPARPPIVSTGDFPQTQWSSPELFFDFSDLSLDSAMKQIAQWYAMSNVEFQPGMNKKKRGAVYIGKISRYLSLEQLLSIIERNDLHFAIRDRTILVTNKTGSH